MNSAHTRFAVAALLLLGARADAFGQARPTSSLHQPGSADRIAIMAVVDSALAFITSGNAIALTDLMLPEAQVYSSRQREGRWVYAMRTRDTERARAAGGPVVERGFDPEIRVSGPVAMVWLPYDIYVNNAWSHCGVDVFTLVRVGTGWRIGNLTYSVEQPPACRENPSGPPPGMKAP